jgi:hypothetical protein
MSFTKLDYCQYLLSSQINYTLTNMADHLQKWSHDTINRYLRGEKPYQRVDELDWSQEELKKGKLIKIKGFPKNCKVKLFRVVVHSRRTEWIVTNDLSRDSAHGARGARRERKIEEFHREAKQLTGIEGCQCRAGRIQRNHIACALLVWSRLKDLAYQSGRTIYRIKHGLLQDYLIQQLKNPSVQMVLA